MLAVQVTLEFLQKYLIAVRVRVFEEVSAYRSRQISLFTEIISPLNFMQISTLY
jgi:hypothetical protein